MLAALAALSIAATGAAQAQREAPTPATPENIKAQCWMQFEKQKTRVSLDKKLELVERCIEEKTKAQPR